MIEEEKAQKEKAGEQGRKLSRFLGPETRLKAGVVDVRYGSPRDPLVTGMEYDSRKVKPGNIYFALPGLHTDGHAFMDDAISRGGASVVVYQNETHEMTEWVTYIRVKNARYAMSALAADFYDNPSRRMAVIGVTGTEGKSTTDYLIYQLLCLLGAKAGFISTVRRGNGKIEYENKEHQTTPEAPTVQRLLWEMRRNGAAFAVVEASSHGLSKRTNRLGDVVFDVGVMTNVTHEHLEFHGTWEKYRSDKAALFRALDCESGGHAKGEKAADETPSFGVVNVDDPSAQFFADSTRHKTYTYSTHGAEADLTLRMIESGPWGNWYEVGAAGETENITIRDRLPGAFNAGNVLSSLLVVSNLLSIPLREAAALVPYLMPVKGRMTAVDRGQPFEVLVDYAHTPSSFQTIFPPLRERSGGGKIISLFGSAGERDTEKRPAQGRIASAYSDVVILTDEDPRGEEPTAILEEIAGGILDKVRDKNLFLIPSRPAAIRRAFSFAEKGDLVLLLGKGHENSIIYEGKILPYDEITEAGTALEELGYHQGKPADGAQASASDPSPEALR
jgi:UDP-N-acetylmuramoyl-L-alanyl-D-glutamate--2,6-diaminopimelate ligase